MSLEIPDADGLLKDVKQDVLAYSSNSKLDKPLISTELAQKFYHNYLNYYFSPWNNPTLLYSKSKVKQIEESLIKEFTAEPGWGENQQLHIATWINAIVQNMNMKTWPNADQAAITIDVTRLRELPTDEPSFKNWTNPVQGYPFDRAQVSLLPANLPIKIVQISADYAWALVLTPYRAIGWLPVNDFAFVDRDFMESWQTGHYAAIIKDKLSVLDSDQHFLFFGRIGSLHPIMMSHENNTASHYHILVAKMKDHHQAISQMIKLAKQDAAELPMQLTPQNIGKIANVMMGQPYDWGGYYGYRDCSSTIMDLFAPFGFWLPRNSTDQAHSGKFISFELLDEETKPLFIRQHGVPFLTLLSLPGHIALYLGEQNDRSFVYQTVWSWPIRHWFKGRSRVIIGKTVITPISFEDFSVDTTAFLKRMNGMTLLGVESDSNLNGKV